MAAADVDLLLLGRQGNARYVAGHRPIWRAVVTPWAPFAALRSDGTIHLLHTTWDDGVPEEIPHEHLSGLSWNPRVIVGDIAAIPGLGEARRIATDGMSAGLGMLLGHLAADAELVDGEALMRTERAVKLPDEVECLRTSIALTEGALTAAAAEIGPGVDPSALKGAFHEAMGRYGLSHPHDEGSFGSGAPIAEGDLVPLSGALAFAGYEPAVGRSRWCGPAGPVDEWADAMAALVDGCRPGAEVPEGAHGCGVGMETIVGPLRPGMVVGLHLTVGAYVGADTILVTEQDPERLTHLAP
jgi:Xaa-Pro aminopeptidase